MFFSLVLAETALVTTALKSETKYSEVAMGILFGREVACGISKDDSYIYCTTDISAEANWSLYDDQKTFRHIYIDSAKDSVCAYADYEGIYCDVFDVAVEWKEVAEAGVTLSGTAVRSPTIQCALSNLDTFCDKISNILSNALIFARSGNGICYVSIKFELYCAENYSNLKFEKISYADTGLSGISVLEISLSKACIGSGTSGTLYCADFMADNWTKYTLDGVTKIDDLAIYKSYMIINGDAIALVTTTIHVFFDGTSNTKESGTNVWNMFNAIDAELVEFFPESNPDKVEYFVKTTMDMHAIYVSGIGTSTEDSPALKVSQATGAGSENRAVIAYDFVTQILEDSNVAEKDLALFYRLNVIGFSRGAATARLFATYTSSYGYASENVQSMSAYNGLTNLAVTWYDQKNPSTQGKMLPIAFLGVYDTVETFLTRIPALSVSIPSSVVKCFHSVAINEERRLFNYSPIVLKPNWEEKYYIGCHGDVGGWGNRERQKLALTDMIVAGSLNHGMEKLLSTDTEYRDRSLNSDIHLVAGTEFLIGSGGNLNFKRSTKLENVEQRSSSLSTFIVTYWSLLKSLEKLKDSKFVSKIINKKISNRRLVVTDLNNTPTVIYCYLQDPNGQSTELKFTIKEGKPEGAVSKGFKISLALGYVKMGAASDTFSQDPITEMFSTQIEVNSYKLSCFYWITDQKVSEVATPPSAAPIPHVSETKKK